jgi:hypothetical protein
VLLAIGTFAQPRVLGIHCGSFHKDGGFWSIGSKESRFSPLTSISTKLTIISENKGQLSAHRAIKSIVAKPLDFWLQAPTSPDDFSV